MGSLLSLCPQTSSLHCKDPYTAFPCNSETEISKSASRPIPNSIPSTLVGTGSFSNVYKISPTRAIKVLNPSRCNTTNYANIEAGIYCSLPPSPHILRFHGLPAPGIIELEYCPTGTVQDYIRNISPQPNNSNRKSLLLLLLSSLATQTVRAISHIHTHNILHNDLGTRQLLLTRDLTVKLADFGSSSFIGGCKGVGIPNATHRMPRSASASASGSGSGPDTDAVECSIRADLFALGSTLYEIFSGGWAPYWDLRDGEVRALFAERVWPDLEEGLEVEEGTVWKEVILRCWEGRFEGADEILEILGEGVSS